MKHDCAQDINMQLDNEFHLRLIRNLVTPSGQV